MNQFPLSSKQKVPFVCLDCRFGFKKTIPFLYEECGDKYRPAWANPPCPRCRKPTIYLGRYFKIPPQSALDQWRKVELLWRSGWIANGYCGAPRTLRDAREFVRKSSADVVDRTSQRRAEVEEKWQKLKIKREQLRRHKCA